MADLEAPKRLEGKRSGKRWLLGTAAGLLTIFVAQNAQEVQVDFLWVNTTTPLIFALVIAGALGALIGWLGPRLLRDD
jgi:uncharacterized integral membrane protein